MAFLFLVIFIKGQFEEVVGLFYNSLMLQLQPIFELVVDCRQKEVQHQVKSYDQVAYKEKHIPVLISHGRQHHIWKISRRKKD